MEEETKDTKVKAVDPGWNDPPIFSYSSHEAHTRQTKGVSLNKRVVFPMSNLPTQKPTVDNSASLPCTPPASSIAGPPKSVSKAVNLTSTECLPKENSDTSTDISLEVVIRNFTDTLNEISTDNEKETKEIQRRLAIMEKMWTEEKFNQIVKDKIYKLSTALKEKRFDDGNSMQMSLMVDHSAVCSNWIAAIRILMSRKKELSDS
ncbi:hypothetical protein O3M35_012865 [Rhynocoris fuscipes]|uniref:SRA1/Sec31 domain-containing protein n=1 Tax=Rhynocoris fuscipes TaxID=488301 RepID=A0AAW1CFN3_9HEMI